MKVDSFATGLTEGVLHELLHAVLRKEMDVFDVDTEEMFIDSLELAIIKRINKSKYKLQVWRNAITRKMEES